MKIMGMFDIVKVDVALLPVTDEEKVKLSECEFQTKDLGFSLDVWELTDGGAINHRTDEVYIEPFNFYTLASDNEWFEFRINFENGLHIERYLHPLWN